MTITSSAGALALASFSEADQLWLARYCAYHSGDRNAAEDLAQETLVEAWRNHHKLRDLDKSKPWLAAIARNICQRWRSGILSAADRPLPPNPSPEREGSQRHGDTSRTWSPLPWEGRGSGG